MTLEKLTAKIMKECEADGEPVTKEEAEEMAKMELKASGNRHYEQSEKPRKAVKKERKVDETKKRLLNDFRVLVEGLGGQTLGIKSETELEFWYQGASYNLKLVKHREKKVD